MLRCAPWIFAAAACLAVPALTQAQTSRPFTAQALRGEIVVLQAPDVLLNGKAARLAPGARIRGENNLLQLPGSLVDQALVVNYTLDGTGLIQDVWVLTAEERARWPWPTTAAQAAAWTFDPVTQTWSRP